MALKAPHISWRTARRLPLPLARRRCFSTSQSSRTAYGFIGLGRMGYNMAKVLRMRMPESDSLVVHDLNTTVTQQFMDETSWAKASTAVAETPKELAEQSDTIFTALPEPHHVRSVFDSILSSPHIRAPLDPSNNPRLFIDCSTIDPITSRAIAAGVSSTLQSQNGSPTAYFLDAPMSGGVVGAAAAKLTYMLGCPTDPPHLLERAKTVLSLIGARVVHLGPQGAGLAGKLANNYLLAVANIATAEAMSMGIQWGLDPKALAGMINTSTGRCWPSEVNNPVPGVVDGAPAGRGYDGGFGISLMKKDLGLALDSASSFGVKNELGATAMEVYANADKDDRCHGKDFSSVYRWLDGPSEGA